MKSSVLILIILYIFIIPVFSEFEINSLNWQPQYGSSSQNQRPLLYHKETRKCYPALTKCSGLMLFYPAGDGYGECDCDVELEAAEGRQIIYWPPYNRCYRIFDRGPCRPTEWLTIDKYTGEAICRPNPCLAHQQMDRSPSPQNFWFYQMGKCWKHGMVGNCPDNPYFRIRCGWPDFDEFGNCVPPPLGASGAPAAGGGFGALVSTDTLPCKRGHKFHEGSKICKRAAKLTTNYAALF